MEYVPPTDLRAHAAKSRRRNPRGLPPVYRGRQKRRSTRSLRMEPCFWNSLAPVAKRSPRACAFALRLDSKRAPRICIISMDSWGYPYSLFPLNVFFFPRHPPFAHLQPATSKWCPLRRRKNPSFEFSGLAQGNRPLHRKYEVLKLTMTTHDIITVGRSPFA